MGCDQQYCALADCRHGSATCMEYIGQGADVIVLSNPSRFQSHHHSPTYRTIQPLAYTVIKRCVYSRTKNALCGNEKILKDDLRGSLDRDIVPVPSAVDAVLLLLDRHREFLERLVVESSIAQDTSVLSGQGPLMRITREECY